MGDRGDGGDPINLGTWEPDPPKLLGAAEPSIQSWRRGCTAASSFPSLGWVGARFLPQFPPPPTEPLG